MIAAALIIQSASDDAVAAPALWIASAMTGSLAVIICVIAVAAVGLLMLTGRLAVRRALRVVLGCFLVFGAPLVANSLLALRPATGVPAMEGQDAVPVRSPPPATYDPYAGASLIR